LRDDAVMNKEHLELCASTEWADALSQWIVPWALDDVELGSDAVEFGPGPGLTTDILRTRTQHLTAVEVDEALAAALADRFAEADDVTVIHADGTASGLEGSRYTAVVCLTMLHHVPSTELQDAIFAEARRLLTADGVFAGSDSRDSPDFRALHAGDVCVPVDPATLAERLNAAGFTDVEVETNEWAVRFRARP